MPHSLCLVIMLGFISMDTWTLILSGAENPILIHYMTLYLVCATRIHGPIFSETTNSHWYVNRLWHHILTIWMLITENTPFFKKKV